MLISISVTLGKRLKKKQDREIIWVMLDKLFTKVTPVGSPGH